MLVTSSGWMLFDESHQDVIDLYGDGQAQSWIIEQPALPSADALGHAASPVATQCLDYGCVRTELFGMASKPATVIAGRAASATSHIYLAQ